MRLLYVIDSLAPGGAEMSLVEMTSGLIGNNVDLHVLPLGNRTDLRDHLETVGATVHLGPERKTRVGFARRVGSVIREIQPDLVHTTLYEANIAGRIAAHRYRVPASTSLVGDTYGRRPEAQIARLKLGAARVLDAITAGRSTRFHAVSQHLANSAVRYLGLSPDRIEVIPRGRDKQRFPFCPGGVRSEVRYELGIARDTPVVLAVGRLERVKGLVHLMDALHELSALVPDVQVLVAGKDGAAGDEIRAAAERSRAPVSFLGHRGDVGRLLAAADVLAFPSLSEGSPGTLIEAMATGCPIVASDIPPNVEVLGAGSTSVGTIVPVGNSAALARALASCFNEPATAQRRAILARQRFEDRYEIVSVARRMAHFFQRASSHGEWEFEPSGVCS